MVIGWFISKLSAGAAKWEVENTSKGTLLICGPTIPPLGLAGRDDDDGGDGDDDGNDGVLTSKYVLLLTKVMIMTMTIWQMRRFFGKSIFTSPQISWLHNSGPIGDGAERACGSHHGGDEEEGYEGDK